jgi:hypothetical protein
LRNAGHVGPKHLEEFGPTRARRVNDSGSLGERLAGNERRDRRRHRCVTNGQNHEIARDLLRIAGTFRRRP